LSFTYRRNGGGGGGGDADRDEPYTLTIPALDLQPGQQMLITGSSGCGKSTLLSLIAGLLEAKHGRIAVAGTDMVTLRGAARDAHRGRHIGMIFQTFHLVGGMSSIENVELALMFSTLPPGEHRQRARYLLDRLGLTASNADRFVERLSVGQQQRVAIARAVACKPALVLADEPTAALDPDNARAAMDLIQTCCREAGAALLCVSHDTSIAERFLYRSTLADLVAGRGAGGHIAK
jgi:putative ABC transport system ATP-binding protein